MTTTTIGSRRAGRTMRHSTGHSTGHSRGVGRAPRWQWAPLLVPVLACGGPDGRDEVTTVASSVTFNPPTSGPMATAGTMGSESEDDDVADSGETRGGTKLDVGGNDSGPGDTGNECASIDDTAMVGMQPADIIVVVDNSGSMQLEAGFVQNNMNVFSSQIFLANIDAHVVLISATSNDDTGICIPTPLGSGACPDDTKLPGYFPRIIGIDIGWDHPTAAVWLAHDPDADVIYVLDCYRQSKEIPAVHAAAIKARGKGIPQTAPRELTGSATILCS